MELEWRVLQALELSEKNKMLINIETFEPNESGISSSTIFFIIAIKCAKVQTRLHRSIGY